MKCNQHFSQKCQVGHKKVGMKRTLPGEVRKGAQNQLARERMPGSSWDLICPLPKEPAAHLNQGSQTGKQDPRKGSDLKVHLTEAGV